MIKLTANTNIVVRFYCDLHIISMILMGFLMLNNLKNNLILLLNVSVTLHVLGIRPAHFKGKTE